MEILIELGISMMKEKGIFLVPTQYIGKYFDQNGSPSGALNKMLELQMKTKQRHFECMRKAIKAGVKILVGTDFVGWDPKLNVKEFECLVELGMSSVEALKSGIRSLSVILICKGTSLGGELLQWEVGSIEKGKFADIIAIDGNPIKNIQDLEKVKVLSIKYSLNAVVCDD
jgi:imidazolonepropionase-like amidohydrolase